MKQSEALEIMKMGRNVFLTGAPGAGKTYVLNQYLEELRERGVSVGITASTGIAATHIGGMTIHSWSGLGVRDFMSEEDLERLTEKKPLVGRIRSTRVLVIDEISMLSAAQLEAVDMICRQVRGNEYPFGGMQVILSGDFFQLPPVRKGHFVFGSSTWEELDLAVCYLTEQYRQDKADELTEVLTHIREGNAGEHTKVILRTCYKRGFEEGVIPTKLSTHNRDVDTINTYELEQLDEKYKTYAVRTEGPRALVESLIKSCLAPEELSVKVGALVMFVKNSPEGRYVNGTLGTVVGFEEEYGLPEVETHTGELIVAEPEVWAIEEGGEVRARIWQVPLRLAWAITVHKSQGMSLDAAEMDLSKAFEPGMGYVALSRVRSLEGLCLMGLNDVALTVDDAVARADGDFREASEQAVDELEALSKADRAKRQKTFLDRITPTDKEKKKPKAKKGDTLATTRALVEDGKTLEEIAEARGLKTATILDHLEKLKAKDPQLDLTHMKPDDKLFTRVKKAFEEAGDTKLTPVKRKLKDVSYETLRLVRLFLCKE